MQNQFQRRILVIDDNPAIYTDFQKILADRTSPHEKFGEKVTAPVSGVASSGKQLPTYRLSIAHQASEALQLVQQALRDGDPFHLAFVDMRVPPAWNGLEIVEKLWQADPFLQTVVYSATPDYAWDAIHARLGDSDRLLLLKTPFDHAELSQMAAALTEKYRLAQLAQSHVEELDRVVEKRTQELQRSNDQLRAEVNQRRIIEDHLRHDVLHDRLTGLPNRALLIDRIEQCVLRGKRDPSFLYALLFMDVDNFKTINDTLGHEAGDQLLIAIGRELGGAVRSLDVAGRLCDDVTSRLGGDEFVILLDGLEKKEDALLVARRVAYLMSTPVDLGGREIATSLSVGVAMGRPDYERAADILRDADTAVYRAKHQGKNRIAVFDAAMHHEARERLELETDLRKAVSADQICLVYQPVVSLISGEISGFEALIRWRHPVHGLTAPARFIPMAETTGLIVPLGAEVIRQACQQVLAWRQQFAHHAAYGNLWVSVNLSGKQLHTAGLADQIGGILDEIGLEPSALKLEITESAMALQREACLETLQNLRKRGFELSLDDFGAEHSSLNQLHRIPVQSVKVDQSVIHNLGSKTRSHSATVHAIIDLAHNCAKTVVGEGIETIDQLVQLQALECDFAQGFWFSRPIGCADAQELLHQNLGPALWRTQIQDLAESARAGEATTVAAH